MFASGDSCSQDTTAGSNFTSEYHVPNGFRTLTAMKKERVTAKAKEAKARRHAGGKQRTNEQEIRWSDARHLKRLA